MGFFDHLRKSDHHSVKKSKSTYRVALVGLNWATLRLFSFFAQKFGSDQVVIIEHKGWSEDHLFYPGPCVDRGESSEVLLRHFFPHISLEGGREPLFYKNKKFYQFSGRAKPYPLKEGEVYFKESCRFFEPKVLLDSCGEDIMKLAQQSLINEKIVEIDYDFSGFFMILGNSCEVVCESLLYGHSPREFIRLFKGSKKLKKGFIDFSSQFEKSFSLVVNFESRKKVMPSYQTFFLPQSEVHEWGHFIVEAEDILAGQLIKVHCHMDASRMEGDEITKKIKLLKRTLKRLYPHFHPQDCREKIYLLDISPFSHTEQNQWVESLSHFAYFGWNAPLDQDFLSEKNIPIEGPSQIRNNARALLSIEQIQKQF